MKVSRDDLKALVKECLVELLSEGLGRHAAGRSQVAEVTPRKGRHMPLSSSGTSRAVPTVALREAIKREAGGNPIMAGIFADTAERTLPRMIEGEMPGSVAGTGDAATMVAAAHAPEQIFGKETTDKWEHLAFTAPHHGVKSQRGAQLDE